MSQVTTLNAHSQLILKTYSVQRIREFSAHMELPVCQFYLFFFADGIVAAIQIYIEHGTIVAQIDLKDKSIFKQGCAFTMAATKAKL